MANAERAPSVSGGALFVLNKNDKAKTHAGTLHASAVRDAGSSDPEG